MGQNRVEPVSGITFRILVALSISHCINDSLQSVITAVYPLFKDDLALTFAQIGLITLVFQLAGSVFQPLTGLYFDKRPSPWSLPIGMTFTLIGMLSLSVVNSFPGILCSVALIGVGSSVFHPEASRLTSLASGGKRGLAQSLFQVGGNLGGSLGPLLVAIVVAPYGRSNIAFFSILAFIAILVMTYVGRWYKGLLLRFKQEDMGVARRHVEMPLSLGKTIFSISILLILIFSKYIYMASLSSYYTFYLIEKFGVSVQSSQLCLFIFIIGKGIGKLIGGAILDKI